jgi:hypothetical protein
MLLLLMGIEIMVKEMPASEEYGPAVQLHEVTGSGIDRYWNENILNANRLRVRTADSQGDGVFDQECNFPFSFQGQEYSACTSVGQPGPWCSLATSAAGEHVEGSWGFCLDEGLELVQEMEFSNTHTCTDQVAHVCTAQVYSTAHIYTHIHTHIHTLTHIYTYTHIYARHFILLYTCFE